MWGNGFPREVEAPVRNGLESPLAPYYPVLVYHWLQAANEERERHYATLMAKQTTAQFANAEALGYLNRALDLTPRDDLTARYKLLLARESIYNRRGNRDVQAQDLLALAELARQMEDDRFEIRITLRQAHFAEATSDYPVAIQTAAVSQPIPYTRSIAHPWGWQWRIPLQHRVGNGLVYCSRYIGDEDARQKLSENIEGEPLTEPRVIKFRPGQRRKHWNKNCVALGLASGFIEPLESTSIHLIQRGIVRLMRLFPASGIRQSDIDEFNRQTIYDIEHIRDFIILHYKVTHRQDSPFWRYCRSMPVPDSLAHRIRLFKETARVFKEPDELFAENSWIQVMLGQGLDPEQYHPVTHVMTDEELTRFMQGIKSQVAKTVAKLPAHHTYVEQYCKAAQK